MLFQFGTFYCIVIMMKNVFKSHKVFICKYTLHIYVVHAKYISSTYHLINYSHRFTDTISQYTFKRDTDKEQSEEVNHEIP